MFGKKRPEHSKLMKGKGNSNYKDGRSLKKYYCKDCGKEISIAAGVYKKGRCMSCGAKNKLKDPKNHPLFGKKGKEASNWKGGFPKCIDCGCELKDRDAKRCQKCFGKIHSIQTRGQNHWNYRDGSSLEDYPSEFNKQLKESIRKRDNYECQNCNMTEEEHIIVYGRVLDIHHIDYNKKNCKEDNLISLCQSCNLRANYNRDYWQEIYTKKMEEIKCQ